jgi:hypothetical protein
MLRSGGAQKQLFAQGQPEHAWFDLRWAPPRDRRGRPIYLRKLDLELYPEIEYIEVKGPCRFSFGELRLRRGRLAKGEVAWAKTELLGKDTLVVATRDEAGVKRISLDISGAPIREFD